MHVRETPFAGKLQQSHAPIFFKPFHHMISNTFLEVQLRHHNLKEKDAKSHKDLIFSITK